MTLDAARSALLLIDLQERLMPAIDGGGAVAEKAGILARAAERLGVPVLVSEQYPRGLGRTLDDLAKHLPAGTPIVEKLTFSAWREEAFAEALAETGRRRLVLAGAETHVCVLQTALDLAALKDVEVAVVADACGSRRAESKRLALERMARRGVEVVSTEMVLFEWLEWSGHDAFRPLSKLIR